MSGRLQLIDPNAGVLRLYGSEIRGRSIEPRRRIVVLRPVRFGYGSLSRWATDAVELDGRSTRRWFRTIPAAILPAGRLDELGELELPQFASHRKKDRGLWHLCLQLCVV